MHAARQGIYCPARNTTLPYTSPIYDKIFTMPADKCRHPRQRKRCDNDILSAVRERDAPPLSLSLSLSLSVEFRLLLREELGNLNLSKTENTGTEIEKKCSFT